jgi:hypothetical protein
MYLNSREMGAARVYLAGLTGDRQDLRAKLARVQDNAEELLRLIRDHVTEEAAQRYSFLSNIVRALEMKGYGPRIRFRERADDFKDLVAVASDDWKRRVN